MNNLRVIQWTIPEVASLLGLEYFKALTLNRTVLLVCSGRAVLFYSDWVKARVDSQKELTFHRSITGRWSG
jgi:hypothetical protein